MIIFVLLPVYW